MPGRILFSVVLAFGILHVQQVSGCVGGRYGRYENWPSKGDWEELFALLSGKGKGGWGWQSSDSYAYNSAGDYPYGGEGSTSSGGSGGFFSSSPHSSGPSYYGKISSRPSVDTNKMKQALSDYFNANKNHFVSTSNAGGIGQTFIDSPGPPSYSRYRDEPLPAGPPYGPTSGDWAGNSGPPSGPPDSPYPWPPPSAPEPVQPFHDHRPQGPSPTLGFNHNSNYNSDNTNRHKNLFQTDYDVLGGKKRRRNGKRRLRTQVAASPEQTPEIVGQGQAGLPIKPKRPLKKLLPQKFMGYRKKRVQDKRKIARRKLKTSFGYKIDFSRFRFW